MAHFQLSSRSTSRHRLSAACDEFARLPSPQGAGQVPAQPTRGVESGESHSRARRCAETSGSEKVVFVVRIPCCLYYNRGDLVKMRPELKTELNFMPIQLKTSRSKFYIVFFKEKTIENVDFG